MAANRERIDTTPGRAGGSRFVRRNEKGQFSSDQASAGRSIAQDRRIDARTTARTGQEDRGDSRDRGAGARSHTSRRARRCDDSVGTAA